MQRLAGSMYYWLVCQCCLGSFSGRADVVLERGKGMCVRLFVAVRACVTISRHCTNLSEFFKAFLASNRSQVLEFQCIVNPPDEPVCAQNEKRHEKLKVVKSYLHVGQVIYGFQRENWQIARLWFTKHPGCLRVTDLGSHGGAEALSVGACLTPRSHLTCMCSCINRD